MKIKLLAVTTVLFLAGCNEPKEQTKEWYKAHDTERHQRIEECKNNAKEQATADCQNALAAQADIAVFGK